MSAIITTANFVGKFAIPQDSFSDLDNFISASYEDYMVDLLGADLYADFKTKYEANPIFPDNPGYLKILNEFKTDYGSKIYKSKGIKAMLCGFIFFDFMRQNRFKATTQGMVANASDTSQAVGPANLYAYLNEATETFQSIQMYVQNIKPVDFPPAIPPDTITFNGQPKSYGIQTFG